jgi:hypothetical protein
MLAPLIIGERSAYRGGGIPTRDPSGIHALRIKPYAKSEAASSSFVLHLVNSP